MGESRWNVLQTINGERKQNFHGINRATEVPHSQLPRRVARKKTEYLNFFQLNLVLGGDISVDTVLAHPISKGNQPQLGLNAKAK